MDPDPRERQALLTAMRQRRRIDALGQAVAASFMPNPALHSRCSAHGR